MRVRQARRAIGAAFPYTVPVMAGYLFLGMAFGILLQSKGYGVLWALSMSIFIFAGSMQFVAVGLLAGGFHPLQALLMTLMVNARHLFYGISMLGRYQRMGREKPYMIFALTDETFSLLVSAEAPADVPENRFFLCIAAMNQLYWVVGSAVGSLVGAAVAFDWTGIEFVMTALFVVIFLEQWRKSKDRRPALMGLGVAALCLLLFGSQWFLIPTMAALTVLLVACRGELEGGMDA